MNRKIIKQCIMVILLMVMLVSSLDLVPVMAAKKNEPKIGQVYWDEMWPAAAKTTTESIEIGGFYANEGCVAQGIQIYRKEVGGKYKLIHTIKNKKRSSEVFTYVDTTVKPRTRYAYRMRTYGTINGKKTYGKYTCSLGFTSVNSRGVFDVQILTPNKTEGERLEIALTSDVDNANLYVNNAANLCTYIYQEKNAPEYDSYTVEMDQYSWDGKTWYDLTDKKIKVAPKKTIYLSFRNADAPTLKTYYKNVKKSYLNCIDCEYNGYTSWIYVDMKKKSGSVGPNAEYYT